MEIDDFAAEVLDLDGEFRTERLIADAGAAPDGVAGLTGGGGVNAAGGL